jgi:hypothetical protein
MSTFHDLLEQLKHEDEVTVLEILGIASDELVDALEGIIFDRQQRVRDYYNEDDETVHGEEG